MFRVFLAALFLFSQTASAVNPLDWIPPLTQKPGAQQPQAQTAPAPAQATQPATTDQVHQPTSTPDYSAQATSPMNRANKTAFVTYQLTGIGPSNTTSYGLAAGVFLTPNVVLFGEYGQGREVGWYGIFDDEDIRAQHVGLHVKHFLGNSFYYRIGVDYRTLDYTNSEFHFFSPNTRFDFEGRSYAINLSIGNQWQWENFTLGCDWVGISVPIKREFRNDYLQDPNDRSDLEDAKNDYVKKNATNLLRFYLGLSF